MPDRVSSLIILIGGALVILALWVLSVFVVRWDTRRRRVTDLEQRAWTAVAIVLPLFGFVLYLFMRILRRYLTPQVPEDPVSEEARRTGVKPHIGYWPDTSRQEPMPQPAWKQMPGEDGFHTGSNGGDSSPAAREEVVATLSAPRQPRGAVYVLVTLQGPYIGLQFQLRQLPARIGRGPDADISLDNDLNVSRRHAEVYEWNGMLRIRDLHSTHGTLVNGTQTTDHPLLPGYRVQIGETVLMLQEIH